MDLNAEFEVWAQQKMNTAKKKRVKGHGYEYGLINIPNFATISCKKYGLCIEPILGQKQYVYYDRKKTPEAIAVDIIREEFNKLNDYQKISFFCEFTNTKNCRFMQGDFRVEVYFGSWGDVRSITIWLPNIETLLRHDMRFLRRIVTDFTQRLSDYYICSLKELPSFLEFKATPEFVIVKDKSESKAIQLNSKELRVNNYNIFSREEDRSTSYHLCLLEGHPIQSELNSSINKILSIME